MLDHTAIEGFEAVTVDTGPLTLSLIPGLGGKISSLRDKRNGREWLWRHPRMAYAQVPHGSNYITRADTGGWDECFPSVAPCRYPLAPWQGAEIQDHGELWSQTARLEIETLNDSVKLKTTWQGVVLPYVFERTITLSKGSAIIHSDYIVHNQSDAPLPFIWCAHPLLAIEPGMTLHLPAGATFNIWASVPPDLLEQERQAPSGTLPIDSASRSIDCTLQRTGRALKIWSNPLNDGQASLRASDGALQMRWDVAKLPQVAVWMNLGAWAGDGGEPYFNLGLEPCIGAQDSLEQAVNELNLYETVPAGGEYRWSMEIELSYEL
jgi:galactose mutarotase-like enzyme